VGGDGGQRLAHQPQREVFDMDLQHNKHNTNNHSTPLPKQDGRPAEHLEPASQPASQPAIPPQAQRAALSSQPFHSITSSS
jgi:hypothetical protein